MSMHSSITGALGASRASAIALTLSLCLLAPTAAAEKVFLKVDEALKLAFPECVVERGTRILTKQEQEQIEKLAGEKLESRIVHPYVARKQGVLVGTAYFDTHRVRTLRETLMVVVDPEGRVRRVEVLAFGEPLEYLPSARWFAQFLSLALDDELRIKRKIKGLTGATLSATAATAAIRRVLATHERLQRPVPKPPPAPGSLEDTRPEAGSEPLP